MFLAGMNAKWLAAIRYALCGFSVLYAWVVRLRHWLYDTNILRSVTFADIPVICIGNIHVGGTGKTPMVCCCAEILLPQQCVVIGRGYKKKRQQKCQLVNANTPAQMVGDELCLLKRKYPALRVLSAADRAHAIRFARQQWAGGQVFLLDDAMQHRRVRPSYTVLLCPYDDPYPLTYTLPTGRLRDLRCRARHVQSIVVTKCPPDLSATQAQTFRALLNPTPQQKIFFACLAYDDPRPIFAQSNQPPLCADTHILLVQGVAQPNVLHQHLVQQTKTVSTLYFSDHHRYHERTIRSIRKRFLRLHSQQKTVVITTEKDAVKFLAFADLLMDIPILSIAVRHHFLFDTHGQFADELRAHVRQFPFFRSFLF